MIEIYGVCTLCGMQYSEENLNICNCCEDYVCTQCFSPLTECSVCKQMVCGECIENGVCKNCIDEGENDE